MTDTIPEARPKTAEGVKPLSEAERKKMNELVARATAELGVHAPAVRVGKPYVALVNLSLPRREQLDPKDPKSDLIPRGETVWLTDDEAAKFMRHGSRDGRRVAVIRPLDQVDTNNIPNPPPQLLTGPIFRPVTPAPGTESERPDPPGSTRIVEQTSLPPEAQVQAPMPGGAPSIQDAIDLPPGSMIGGGEARESVMAGADQDLMAAVKQQTGMSGRRGTPNDGRR